MNRLASRLSDRLAAILALSLTGAVGAASLAEPPPQTPIDEVKSAARILEDANSHFVRANDFARELVRIVDEDPDGAEMKSACRTVAKAGFGESFSIETSGFGTTPETFPAVFTHSGGTAVVEDLHLLPIDAAWMPQGAMPAGTAAFVDSARFGAGPEHVGICTVFDTWTIGLAAGPDAPLRTVVSFSPIDLIDPASAVTGPLAVQFLHGTVSGAFDASGSLHQWIFDKVRAWSREGSSSGLAGRCDWQSLMECLQSASANLDGCVDQLDAKYDRIRELEKQLAESAKDAVTAAVSGAVGGGLGGLWGGAIGGPLASLLAGIGGAAVGAAGGLIGWALLDDADVIAEKLSVLRVEVQRQLCACAREWAGRTKSCFSIYCPDLADEAGWIIDETMMQWGC